MFETLGVFQPFPKIPRLHGDVVVTEKIDGTNACFEHVRGEACTLFGACSRNRRLVTITVKDAAPDHPEVTWHGTDNYGFGAFVVRNYATLARLGYGNHFGEWYGEGIQRTYGLDHKRFALFREPKGGLPQGIIGNVGVVPVLMTMEQFDTSALRELLIDLQLEGSRAVPGFMRPEGIVAWHARSGQLFKYTVDAGPKGQKEE